MTVLIVLFFISLALFTYSWQEKKQVQARNRARAPDLSDVYVHDSGLLTMADGGQKIPTNTLRTKVGILIRKLLHKAKTP